MTNKHSGASLVDVLVATLLASMLYSTIATIMWSQIRQITQVESLLLAHQLLYNLVSSSHPASAPTSTQFNLTMTHQRPVQHDLDEQVIREYRCAEISWQQQHQAPRITQCFYLRPRLTHWPSTN